MAESKNIDVVLGTMTFGDQVDEEGSRDILSYFFEQGYNNLDTAILYCSGKTETILGRVLTSEEKSDKYIASKVNNNTEPHKSLSKESVFSQVETILKKLQTESIDLLKTPFEETLSAINDLHKQGKFKDFGLSNFAAWEVVDVWHICNKNGWVLPTVYQGMYNAITRDIETELIPALRKFNMKLFVYNPLAGGLLTGKHTFNAGGSDLQGRFKSQGGSTQDRYIVRYWKQDIFDALAEIQKACSNNNISMTEASIRWVRHHSKLIAGDKLIIGASKIDHLKENLKFCKNEEKLPETVVKAFDVAWEKAQPVCEQYWR